MSGLVYTRDADGINQTPVSATNPLPVAGPAANLSSTAVNPTDVSGVYSSSGVTVANGQRSVLQIGPDGLLGARLQVGTGAMNGNVSSLNGAQTDGVSNVITTYRFLVRPEVYNGSTHDRLRGDSNALAVQPALSSAFWNYAAASGGISNTTTAVTIKAAAGANVRNYLQALQLDWDALTNATEVAIRDGAGGTVLWRGKLPSGAAGQRQVVFNPPLKGTANTLMEIVTLTASGAGAVYANGQGWTGA